MAFKRYIHRHGKKLGPYYYENVRSDDGKVKSIYLGTNPHHHPKHRIRKPLFFLILVLMLILILGGSLFLLQNKSYLIKKVKAHEPDFEIDQILLKVLIRSGEFLEKQVRIMNTGNNPSGIDVIASGLSDIIKIDSPSFVIKPGQTKVVTLNFSSIVPEQGIEQQPGIYVGKLIAKSEKAAKEVPVVVEIETKNVLFDMNLNPVAIERRVKQGSDTTIEVRLFNLESIESVNVDVEYFVKDMNGNTIITESETVVVKTQASFFKTISIPKNLKPGPYVFAAIAKFGNSIGTSSYLFEVIGPETESSFIQFCKNSVLCLGLSLTTILLLFALIAYFYFFIGAYLYEKVTGVVTIPRKRKEKEVEIEETQAISIFEKIKNKLEGWKKVREIEKSEKKRLEREEKLKELAKGEVSPSKEFIKFYEILDKAEEAVENEDSSKVEKLYIKARDLYAKLPTQEERGVYGKLVELYDKRNQLAKKSESLKELEQKKEEQIQQKEIDRQKNRQKILEEKRRQEELRRQDEISRQKELEKQKALEEKKRLEEERKARQEQEKRQKEAEKQKQELVKSQKLAAIKQLEERLARNKELSEQLRKELRSLESEKRELSSANNDIDARIKRLDHDILEKSRHNEELSLQKNSMFENYQKQLNEIAQQQQSKKAAREEKIRELKAKLASKQEYLMKELEDELSKLSLEKRKTTEKWKRLEIKAKLKIEEQNIEEQIKEEETSDGRKSIEDNYKKSVEDLSKKQNELKKAVAELEDQKQQILLEKRNVPRGLAVKENELQKILLKLETNAREKEALSAELSKLRSELSKFSIHFIKSLVSGYKEKAEKRKGEEQRLKGQLEEERKKREDEKQKAREEKLEFEEELFAEKAKLKEPAEKEPGIFARLFAKGVEPREEEKEISEEEPLKAKKSEAEELEEAIRGLDLFKKVEKGRKIEEKHGILESVFKEKIKPEAKKGIFGKLFEKEKKEAAEEKPAFGKLLEPKKIIKEKAAEIIVEKKPKSRPFKSKKLEKFYKILDNAKAALAKNDLAKAKKLYLEAREEYIKLDYSEKKEVYGELTKLYNDLSK